MTAARVDIKGVKTHPLEWLIEPLETQSTYIRKKMFGCEAVYLNGKLMLVLTASEEPWNGVLVATSREHHPTLQADWGQLTSHPVLGKWLYISQNNAAFESTATSIVKSILKSDSRIGVEPKPKKMKRTSR